MPTQQSEMFSLGNLYVAYKKAKAKAEAEAEAFYENTHFHALAFTNYEQALNSNLEPVPNPYRCA